MAKHVVTFVFATKYRSKGKCGHRHMAIDGESTTQENCQRVLTQTGSQRAIEKAKRKHVMGGRGKKFGLHGKKRQKRAKKG